MSKMPDNLLGGRLIVKPLEQKEEISEGVIIPKTANSNLTEGLVILADPDIEKYIKKGNIVIFPTGSGVGQFIDNKPHLWLNANEIWGTFSMDDE
jgi:co-chaperonin GroES (HSP10)